MVWSLAILLWLAAPVFYGHSLVELRRAGSLSAGDEELTAAIVDFVRWPVLGAPVLFGFVWFALREYRAVSLLAWNRGRAASSAAWSVLLIAPAALLVWWAVLGVLAGHSIFLAGLLLGAAYLLLVLRAALMRV
ncbi:MAG: hypothetical protein KIT25_09820 [Enhydrobacter sp.]|nr:MAG: hypothetical protein KIT25_09820 [Enhydrobacter sp.]